MIPSLNGLTGLSHILPMLHFCTPWKRYLKLDFINSYKFIQFYGLTIYLKIFSKSDQYSKYTDAVNSYLYRLLLINRDQKFNLKEAKSCISRTK